MSALATARNGRGNGEAEGAGRRGLRARRWSRAANEGGRESRGPAGNGEREHVKLTKTAAWYFVSWGGGGATQTATQ